MTAATPRSSSAWHGTHQAKHGEAVLHLVMSGSDDFVRCRGTYNKLDGTGGSNGATMRHALEAGGEVVGVAPVQQRPPSHDVIIDVEYSITTLRSHV